MARRQCNGSCQNNIKRPYNHPCRNPKDHESERWRQVLFIQDGDKFYIENATIVAINRMQEVFAGEAEHLDLETEDDAAAMVKEIRPDRWEKKHVGNA
jgi:type IV secretory pathway VirB9-like protein